MSVTKRSGIILGILLIVAFALRVYQSGRYGLYLDEKFTMVISQGVVMEGSNQHDVFFTPGKTYFTPREFWQPKTINDFIEANIRGDIGNSPAYYAVLWVWMEIFGLSDFSARFPSVLFSTLLVGLVYIFVRRHFRSDSLALLSASLAAVEPFFVAYSHMARNYSMSFFLTLLASHLFLLIVERLNRDASARGLYVAYGLTVATAILSHYLTVTVFLCHGLYALFFIRPPRRWLALIVTGLTSLGLVSLWFVFGGGKYTFKTLAYQAQLYKSVSLTNPTHNEFGMVLPATLANVTERSLPIWADLFIVSNGLGQTDRLGFRYLALAFALGLVAAWVLYRYSRQPQIRWWTVALYALLLVAGMPFYGQASAQYIVVSALPSFLYLLVLAVRRIRLSVPNALLVFITMLALIPTLFLIVMAFKNGHTYGITQRYSGFSFPYSVIIVALMLRQLVRTPLPFRIILLAVLLIQSYFVARLLHHIYEDRDVKYTYFSTPRLPNPYQLAADRIKASYAPGDTVLYPSVRLFARDEVEKTFSPYSIQDAQLTNLYLPKEADYIQRMDTTEVNRIRLIQKASGQVITIFDFKGKSHRY
ncbi:glycosyltransferase family 39 protein [Spirosoma rigui]|uniref:glycosyltransferase family 39 protein n=1 Tax=Spirosoma rigui TaxID=564064 RepID=UPI0009B16E02|nr:glycosyltransferase family 39 protein [Spirosoma rigui]